MSQGFDEPRFLHLLELLRSGKLTETQPIDDKLLMPLQTGDIHRLPEEETPEHARFVALGTKALGEGRLACVVVAGGAGTRFGGAVKALVPVLNGKNFLHYKLEDAKRTGKQVGKPVPVAVMTSWLTQDEIAAFLKSN